MAGEDQGGLGPYTPEGYIELEMGEYRLRSPAETMPLSDEQIWDVVSATEDDMSDDEWKQLFVDKAAEVHT